MFHASDAFDGVVETPREGHASVEMAAREVDPAEKVLRDLAWHRIVVWCKGDVGADAAKKRKFRVSPRKKKRKKRRDHFSADDSMIQPRALIEVFHSPRTGSQVRLLFAIESVKPPSLSS